MYICKTSAGCYSVLPNKKLRLRADAECEEDSEHVSLKHGDNNAESERESHTPFNIFVSQNAHVNCKQMNMLDNFHQPPSAPLVRAFVAHSFSYERVNRLHAYNFQHVPNVCWRALCLSFFWCCFVRPSLSRFVFRLYFVNIDLPYRTQVNNTCSFF